MAKSKGKAGGIPHPTLDHPKNFPGNMPSPAIGAMFGGKAPKQGGPNKSKMSSAGKGGEGHGLHGAKKPPMPKGKKK